MATVLLVRHGRSTANVAGILSGRAPGVDLDDVGRGQADAHGGTHRRRAAGGGDLQPSGAVPADGGDHRGAPAGAVRCGSSPTSPSATTGSGRAGRFVSSPRSRCGRSCRPSRPRPCSRAASRWRPCRPGRSRRSAGTTRRWRPSTAPARCGWRSRTATSSSPSSPTPSACTSTSSSASPSTPDRSRSSGTGPPAPRWWPPTRTRATSRGCAPPVRSATRRWVAAPGRDGSALLKWATCRHLVHQFDWPDRVVVGTVGQPGFPHLLPAGARRRSERERRAGEGAVRRARREDRRDPRRADGRRGEPVQRPRRHARRARRQRASGPARRGGVPRRAAAPGLGSVDRAGRRRGVPAGRGADGRGRPSRARCSWSGCPSGTARAFVERTRQVVRSGRPLCPSCGEPVDDDGHVCGAPAP